MCSLDIFVCFRLMDRLPWCFIVHVISLEACHWFILLEIKVTLMCHILSYSLLAPAGEALQLYSCTFNVQCNSLMCYRVGVRSILLSIYIYLYTFLCISVST